MEIWSRQLKVTWGAHAGSWRVKCQLWKLKSHVLVVPAISCDLDDPWSWPVNFPISRNVTFHIPSSLILYIPSLSTKKCKEPIERKNPKRAFYNTPTLLERELLILREKIFVVSSPSLSHCYTHWEEICTQTLLTPIQSVESFFGAWEALEDAKDGWCDMELITGSGKLEKTRFSITLLEQEVWRV